jgi:hypothetical protein
LMKYLNGTRDDKLILSADKLNVVKWYVDTSFAVHPDFKSHTGGVLTLGRGALTSLSKKQKLNTRSSTEAELVGADDASTLILWTKLFMEAQGYGINSNVRRVSSGTDCHRRRTARRVSSGMERSMKFHGSSYCSCSSI